MKINRDGSMTGWLVYAPKLFYRDVAPVTDPDHVDALRQRDKEVFMAHGQFCRRVVPGEFIAAAMARLDHDAFVVVDFRGDQWRRQIAERDDPPRRPAVIKARQRRGKR